MQQSPKSRAHLLALSAALFWSFSFVCIKEIQDQLLLQGATSWEAGLGFFQIRMLITLLAFIPNIWSGKSTLSAFTKRDWIQVLFLSAMMGFGYHLPLNLGAQHIPTGFVSLIVALGPVFAAVLAYFFLKERLGILRALGVLLGMIGIGICLSAQGKLKIQHQLVNQHLLEGVGYVTLASFCGATFAVIARSIRKEISPSLILGLGIGGTVLFSIPFWDLRIWSLFFHLDLYGWLSLLYLTFIGTYLANVWWYRALQVLDAVQVTIYLNVTTMLALLWGAVLFREQITFLYAVGTACVFTAVILSGAKNSANRS